MCFFREAESFTSKSAVNSLTEAFNLRKDLNDPSNNYSINAFIELHIRFIVHSFFWLTNPSFSSWSSYLSAVVMLLDANSLVNPLLYSIRIPEFRRALKKMFCKPKQDGRVHDFRLSAVQHAD